MFIGTYQNSIDAKNRMIVPAKFRDELGFKCVITLGIDNCLYIYTMDEWESFMEKLTKLPTTDAKARRFSRNFTGSAEECEIDRQGRVTIPQKLRSRVGIIKDLVTIGCSSKIEVWARDEFERDEEENHMNAKDIAEGMEAYGI